MRREGGYVRLPPFAAGQTIGLLGGSFNPPHRGHVLASHLALTRLRLDRVWWLATPGNPLKSRADLAALRARLDAAQALVHDPRIAVTGFESEIGSRYTADTLRYLERRARAARASSGSWARTISRSSTAGAIGGRSRRWRSDSGGRPARVELRRAVEPSRAGAGALAAAGKRARGGWRRCKPPAWIFLHGPRSSASSTALRESKREFPQR